MAIAHPDFLVSVIMPVYNTQDFLPTSIGSLKNQTYSRWELLAVDDGSTDNSLKVLNTYAAADNRIRVFHKQNEGIAKTRAFGLHYAEGQFVFYLDSDDEITPETLESCITAIQENNCDAALPNVIMELPGGVVNDIFACGGLSEGMLFTGQEAFVRSIHWDGIHSCMMCQSDLYRTYACNTNYLFDDFASDELITRRILLACDKIVLSKGTYRYHNNSNSASKKLSPHIFSILNTALRLIDICHEFNMSKNVIAKAEAKALVDMIDFWHSYHKNKNIFTSKQSKRIKDIFSHFHRQLDKRNLHALLKLKPGLTPRLQRLILLNNWTLCRTALNLSETLNMENKLHPFFSNDLISQLT